MFPGRIDLGVARGVGAERNLIPALSTGDPPMSFADKLTSLIGCLNQSRQGNHDSNGEKSPVDAELWILGSGEESARLAAARGCRYAAAHFLTGQRAIESVEVYRRTFPTHVGAESTLRFGCFLRCRSIYQR